MSTRLEQLEGIYAEIKDTDQVSKETRKRFWELLRQIKREPVPNLAEVKRATEIRNHLFRIDRGRTYRIGPFLALETICGLFSFVVFLYGLGAPVDWLSIGSWSISEAVAVIIRFLGLFFVVAFFYPYGRLIAGSALGIRLEAMCYDEYREPTLKIDYETFLLATPSKRKWFFFFSGLWTLLTSLFAGVVGLLLAGDILGIAFALFLIAFYAYVIRTGTTSHGRGEMAHYNREKKIEKTWKRRINSAS